MKYVTPAITDFGSITDNTYTICFPSNDPGGSVECVPIYDNV